MAGHIVGSSPSVDTETCDDSSLFSGEYLEEKYIRVRMSSEGDIVESPIVTQHIYIHTHICTYVCRLYVCWGNNRFVVDEFLSHS